MRKQRLKAWRDNWCSQLRLLFQRKRKLYFVKWRWRAANDLRRFIFFFLLASCFYVSFLVNHWNFKCFFFSCVLLFISIWKPLLIPFPWILFFITDLNLFVAEVKCQIFCKTYSWHSHSICAGGPKGARSVFFYSLNGILKLSSFKSILL